MGERLMPELRIDPVSGLRTIVAGERSQRPGGTPGLAPEQLAPPPIDPASDPFAEGNEQRTPPEIYALRPEGGAPNSGGWSVRVVANLYPALGPAAAQRGTHEPGDELLCSLPAPGAHEVIING